MLASRVYVDLVDADEPHLPAAAAGRGEQGPGATDHGPVPRRGRAQARQSGRRGFPGLGPAVSNLPPRNRNFSGRGDLLERIHADLQAGVGGGGGADRGGARAGRDRQDRSWRWSTPTGSAATTTSTWWIPAEQPTAAAAALAELARRLGIPEHGGPGRDGDRVVRPAPRPGPVAAGLRQRRATRPAHRVAAPGWRWARAGDLPLAGVGPPRHPRCGSRCSSRAESVAFLHRRTGADDLTGLDALAELLGDLPLALEEAAAYLEETRDEPRRTIWSWCATGPGSCSAWHEPAGGSRSGISGGWPPCGRCRWTGSTHEAPAAEALLNLCAFLAPGDPPRAAHRAAGGAARRSGRVVADRLAYNRILAAIGRYSLATVTPTTVGLHRLVQAVIQARLGEAGERAWAEVAVNLVRAALPERQLGGHHLAATASGCCRTCSRSPGTRNDSGSAGEAAGWLLDRASTYLRERGQYRQAQPLAERARRDHRGGARPRRPRGRPGAATTSAGCCGTLGDLSGARAQFERALQIGEAALGPDHPDVGTLRDLLQGLP